MAADAQSVQHSPELSDTDLALLARLSDRARLALERILTRTLSATNPVSKYHAATQELTWLAEDAITQSLLLQSQIGAQLANTEMQVEVVRCRLPSPGPDGKPDVFEWDIAEHVEGIPVEFDLPAKGKKGKKSTRVRKLELKCYPLDGTKEEAHAEISAKVVSGPPGMPPPVVRVGEVLVIRRVLRFFLNSFYRRAAVLNRSHLSGLLGRTCDELVKKVLDFAGESYRLLAADPDKAKNFHISMMFLAPSSELLHYPRFTHALDDGLSLKKDLTSNPTSFEGVCNALRDIQDQVKRKWEAGGQGDERSKQVLFFDFSADYDGILSHLNERIRTGPGSLPTDNWQTFIHNLLTYPPNQYANFLPFLRDKVVEEWWVRWCLDWVLPKERVSTDKAFTPGFCARLEKARTAKWALDRFLKDPAGTPGDQALAWLWQYAESAENTTPLHQRINSGFAGRVANTLIGEFLPHSRDRSLHATERKEIGYRLMGLLETACQTIFTDNTLVGVPILGRGQVLGVLLGTLAKEYGRLFQQDALVLDAIAYNVGRILLEFRDARILEFLSLSWANINNRGPGQADGRAAEPGQPGTEEKRYEEFVIDLTRCLPLAITLAQSVEVWRLSPQGWQGEQIYATSGAQRIPLDAKFDVPQGSYPGYPTLLPPKQSGEPVGLFVPSLPIDHGTVGGYVIKFSLPRGRKAWWYSFWEHSNEIELFFARCVSLTTATAVGPRPGPAPEGGSSSGAALSPEILDKFREFLEQNARAEAALPLGSRSYHRLKDPSDQAAVKECRQCLELFRNNHPAAWERFLSWNTQDIGTGEGFREVIRRCVMQVCGK